MAASEAGGAPLPLFCSISCDITRSKASCVKTVSPAMALPGLIRAESMLKGWGIEWGSCGEPG